MYFVWHESMNLSFSLVKKNEGKIFVFYDNFERVCKERGSNPSRACIDAGLGASRAGNWKKSGALPKQNELQALAEVLDCEVADFFREETKARYRSVDEALRAKEAAEAAAEASLAAELSEDERYVIDLMRSLSRREFHDFMTAIYDFEDSLNEGEKR